MEEWVEKGVIKWMKKWVTVNGEMWMEMGSKSGVKVDRRMDGNLG